MNNGKTAPYIIELLMRGLIVGTALSTALGYIYADGLSTLLTGLGICIGAIFVFAFIRSKTTAFIPFFLLHILIGAAVVVFIRPLGAQVLCAIFLAWCIIDSVAQLKKPFDKGNRIHFAWAAVFLPCSYAAAYMGNPFLEYSCFVLTAVFMALYFIRVGFYNTQDFIENNDRASNMPVKDLRLRSYGLVCGFGAVVGVFMIAVRYMGAEFIVRQIGGALYTAASAFARWIVFKLQGSYVESTETPQEENLFGFVRDAFSKKDMPAFIEVLEKIVRYFFIAALIIGAIAFIVWLIIKLYSIFANASASPYAVTESEEFVAPVSTDKTDGLNKTARIKNKALHSRVRRYYKKYIKKNSAAKKIRLAQNQTPLEISVSLGLGKEGSDAEIRRIYEKARYSQHECGADEIKRLKEYVKGGK